MCLCVYMCIYYVFNIGTILHYSYFQISIFFNITCLTTKCVKILLFYNTKRRIIMSHLCLLLCFPSSLLSCVVPFFLSSFSIQSLFVMTSEYFYFFFKWCIKYIAHYYFFSLISFAPKADFKGCLTYYKL